MVEVAETRQMKSARFDLFDNSEYHPGPWMKRLIWIFFSGIFFQTYIPWPNALKTVLLRWFGSKIGKCVVIKPHVTIKYPWRLIVGDHVWIGENVWIDNLDTVTIGSHVCISQGALLLCGNHNYQKPTFDLITKAISLDDGAWIGAKAVVAPGVTCHSHSVLALGSVATTDLAAYTVYQGNPAVAKTKRSIHE